MAARSVVPEAAADRQRVFRRLAAQRGDGMAQLAAAGRTERAGRGGTAEKGAKGKSNSLAIELD